MRRLVFFAAALIGGFAGLGTAPAWAREPSSQWQVPPGDPLEHSAAGFAKILCSAVFITGRDLTTAIAEDGFFVAPRAERRRLTPTLDRASQAVSVSLPNGRTRTAKLIGDQGCVTLPAGARSVLFTPVPVASTLPDAQTQLWPMGDAVQDGAPAAEIDQRKLAAAVAAAFEPPEATDRRVRRGAQGAHHCRALCGGKRPRYAPARLVDGQEHDGHAAWGSSSTRASMSFGHPRRSRSGRRRKIHAATSASPICCGCRAGCVSSPRRIRTTIPRAAIPIISTSTRARSMPTAGRSRARRSGRPTRSGATATPIRLCSTI